MTRDVALPFPNVSGPDDANGTIPDQSTLTLFQRRRVEALSVAANMLTVRQALFAKTTPTSQPVGVGDLTYLAEWILQGSEDMAPDPDTLVQPEDPFASLKPCVGAETSCEPFPSETGEAQTARSDEPAEDDTPTESLPAALECGNAMVFGDRRKVCELIPPGHEGDCDYTRDAGSALAYNPQA